MKNDLTIYDKQSGEWWHSQGKAFRSLRSINAFRLQHMRQTIPHMDQQRILDVGCGGGLLSIPLLQSGADVVGIDSSAPSIAAAAAQADIQCAGAGTFIHGNAEDLPFPDASFDVVIISDMLEHVDDVNAVLREAVRCLRPDGWLYASTINKTWRSYVLAIVLAEGLGYVPKGTHDWRLFIPPATLIAQGESMGLTSVSVCGERPKIISTLKCRAISVCCSRSLAVSYYVFFRKNNAPIAASTEDRAPVQEGAAP